MASTANNYICGALYWQCAESGAAAEGNALALDATSLRFTWAIYSWGGLASGNTPEEVRLGLASLDSEYWLAFSDYKRGCWRISGPHKISETALPALPEADMVSPAGCAYVAVISSSPHKLRLDWINLVTTLDSTKVYVDASASGPGDGSADNPFTTVEAGIAAAADGMTVIVAPGEYSPPGTVLIAKDIRVEGAGACRTRINESLAVEGPPGLAPVVIEGVSCVFAGFSSAVIASTELQVLNCVLDNGTGISWSDGHKLLAQGCMVDKGDPEEPAFLFAHGDSACTTVIRDCHMTGSISFACGSGGQFVVEGNTINGSIGDASEWNALTVHNNTIINGGISDSSGGMEGVDDEIFRNNQLINSYIRCHSYTARIENNYFDNRNLALDPDVPITGAIDCASGTPTNIIGNTILLPDIPFDGDLYDGQGEFAAIYTSAGAGLMEDNTIIGGSFGIFSASGATSISNNGISGVQVGIYSATRASYTGNVLSDCDVDGMILVADNYIVQQNIIRDCGGAALRIVGSAPTMSPPDLGGGALGSLGLNVISGYGTYALVCDTLGTELPQIYAQHNYWGTADAGAVAAAIYDATDDATLTSVSYEPFLLNEP